MGVDRNGRARRAARRIRNVRLPARGIQCQWQRSRRGLRSAYRRRRRRGRRLGIFHGGMRINLARFFRVTGVVLVFVAAGLVASALHTAHEAGWVTFGQTQAADLTWLMPPGSIISALLTGVRGLHPRPTAIEFVGWLFYLVRMLIIVLWPAAQGKTARTKPLSAATAAPTTDD